MAAGALSAAVPFTVGPRFRISFAPAESPNFRYRSLGTTPEFETTFLPQRADALARARVVPGHVPADLRPQGRRRHGPALRSKSTDRLPRPRLNKGDTMASEHVANC